MNAGLCCTIMCNFVGDSVVVSSLDLLRLAGVRLLIRFAILKAA